MELINYDDTVYDKNYYNLIKNLDPLTLAIKYARNDPKFQSTSIKLTLAEKLEILFKIYPQELQPFYLSIISEIDEMMDPEELVNILPENSENLLEIFDFNQTDLKILELEQDWVFQEPFSCQAYKQVDSTHLPAVLEPDATSQTPNLAKFYENKAKSISNNSGRADFALKLLKLAWQTKNIEIPQTVVQQFEILNQFIYNSSNDYIQLEDLLKMESIEILTNLNKNLSVGNLEFVDTFEKNINLVYSMRYLEYGDQENSSFENYQNLMKSYFRYLLLETEHLSSEAEIAQNLEKLCVFLLEIDTPNLAKYGEFILEIIYKIGENRENYLDYKIFEKLVNLFGKCVAGDALNSGADDTDAVPSSGVDLDHTTLSSMNASVISIDINPDLELVSQHLEYYKLLQRFGLYLTFDRIKNNTAENLIKRIMTGCLNELNKKATILDVMGNVTTSVISNVSNVANLALGGSSGLVASSLNVESDVQLLCELYDKIKFKLNLPVELMLKLDRGEFDVVVLKGN